MGAGLRRSLKGGAKPKRRTIKSSRKGGFSNPFTQNGENRGMFSTFTGMVGKTLNSTKNVATNMFRSQQQPPQPQQLGGRKRRGKKRSRDSHTRKRKGGKTRKTHGTRRRR